MDNKGLFSIDFLFTIAFMLIIGLLFLNLGESNLNSSINLEENVESRLLINKIANSINKVNSNGKGFLEIIQIPQNISSKSYMIIINKNSVTIDINNKKGTSFIFPINLVDNNGIIIQEKRIYSGNDYIIQEVSTGKINIREC